MATQQHRLEVARLVCVERKSTLLRKLVKARVKTLLCLRDEQPAQPLQGNLQICPRAQLHLALADFVVQPAFAFVRRQQPGERIGHAGAFSILRIRELLSLAFATGTGEIKGQREEEGKMSCCFRFHSLFTKLYVHSAGADASAIGRRMEEIAERSFRRGESRVWKNCASG